MIGTALDVARNKESSLHSLRKMLDYPEPTKGGLKAESCGLLLRKIKYFS
jgi:tRNA U38,U39,U40 pseudouridine synthase TruA